MKSIVCTNAVNGIGHSINIPIVNLYHVAKYFTTSALLADNTWAATLHSFEWGYAKGFAHTGHYEHIGILVALIYLCSTLKTGEMTTVCYPIGSGQFNHVLHHVATTSEAETDITAALKNPTSCFDKVLGTFLHGDTAQISNDFLILTLMRLYGFDLIRERIDCIMHCYTLPRILMVLIDNGLTSKFTYTQNAICMIHTIFLNAIDSRVHLATRTVEIRSVYMNAERFATHLLGVHACRISEPIMGMDDIELLTARQHSSDDGKIVYLLVKIGRIASSKADTAQIVETLQIVEIGIKMVTEPIIILCRVAHETILYMIVLDISPDNWHLAHINNLEKGLLLSGGFRHTKGGFYITLQTKALRNTIGGNGESTINLRGKLPSEH